LLLPNTKDTAKSTQNCGSKKPDFDIDSCTSWNPWSSSPCKEIRCKNGTRSRRSLWLAVSHRPH